MSFDSRLRAIEEMLISERITLVMPDGTRKYIPGDGDTLLHLFTLAMRWAHHQRHGGPKPKEEFPPELGWIGDSVDDDESGGQMVGGIRNVLVGPKEEVTIQ